LSVIFIHIFIHSREHIGSSNFWKNSKKKEIKRKANILTWHWGLDFKDALIIFIMRGEVLHSWFATWFQCVLNLLEF